MCIAVLCAVCCAVLFVYVFKWRHFNSEWNFLSFIYVPIESVDYISVLQLAFPLSLSLSLAFCHRKYENGETCALGSVGAVMCKAMRVKIIRKQQKKKNENSFMDLLELGNVENDEREKKNMKRYKE